MFEVTSTSVEAALGVDFAQKYRESALGGMSRLALSSFFM